MNEKQISKKEWLDTYEVCKLYNLHRHTLDALFRRGMIGRSKLLNKNYYKKSEIEAIIKGNYIAPDGKVYCP